VTGRAVHLRAGQAGRIDTLPEPLKPTLVDNARFEKLNGF